MVRGRLGSLAIGLQTPHDCTRRSTTAHKRCTSLGASHQLLHHPRCPSRLGKDIPVRRRRCCYHHRCQHPHHRLQQKQQPHHPCCCNHCRLLQLPPQQVNTCPASPAAAAQTPAAASCTAPGAACANPSFGISCCSRCAAGTRCTSSLPRASCSTRTSLPWGALRPAV